MTDKQIVAGVVAELGLRHRTDTPTRKPDVWPASVVPKVAWRKAAAAEPFRGVATSAGIQRGVFELQSTGVDVSGIRRAVIDYLAALSPLHLAEGRLPIDHVSWRHWANGARYFLRHGVLLEELDQRGRDLALDVIRRSLSEAGYRQVIDMMHLNLTIGELRNETHELNEWLYWFSVYGDPETGPWGWQLDGHHVNVNCVFVGDQMVLTPTFMGAEPVYAESGRYAGTHVFVEEESLGQRFFESLTDDQQRTAIIADRMPDDLFVGQFRDNLTVDYAGLNLKGVSEDQAKLLTELLGIYTNRANPGHARLRLDEVLRHADQTHFSWIGDPAGVFYYRIHNPVILIEFDHQHGVLFANEQPTRHHIHTLVRTPNGNDYGNDLLRQHHEQFQHADGQHIARNAEHQHKHHHHADHGQSDHDQHGHDHDSNDHNGHRHSH